MWYSIFEAIPEPDKGEVAEAYYKSLLPKVKGISGFVKDTFLVSPHITGKAVNIAEWKDAEAISQWRNEDNHLRAQGKGPSVYSTYRLRLGPGLEAADGRGRDTARHYVVLYYRDSFDGTPEDDVTSLFDSDTSLTFKDDMLDSSVFQGPRILWVSAWKSQDAAEKLIRTLPWVDGDTLIKIAVNRDYTNSDRKDAPSELPGDKRAEVSKF